MLLERFKRTVLLLGEDTFKEIINAHVTIIGLGAVGYGAAEAMVRYGIGSIRLVDFDIIRESNINRQLLALESTVGQSKVKIARARLLDINPSLNIELYERFFHDDTFQEIFNSPTHLVIDAIDSFGPKASLLELLYKKKIPVISSMGAAQRTDPFAIRTGDLFETRGCPLAARIRKQLRRVGISNGIHCVYSTEPAVRASLKTAKNETEEEFYERGRKRQPVGSISYITGIFGYIIASEALKFLTTFESSKI